MRERRNLKSVSSQDKLTPWSLKGFYLKVTISLHHKNHDGDVIANVIQSSEQRNIKLKSNKHNIQVQKGCNQGEDQKLIEM